jgi:tryptophan 2,3-dioxygenase
MSSPKDHDLAAAAAPPPMSYGQYLGLDQLLTAQTPLSQEHDELLFIVIHQTSELWLKQCLHELTAACGFIARDELGPALKMIARVSRIQTQLIQSWDVLATMTPADYSRIRPSLGRSSGFQSYQYRALEFAMGARNQDLLAVHEGTGTIYEGLTAALHRPSLYDEAIRLLQRRGFDLPKGSYDRDFSLERKADPAVEAAWLAVYRDTEHHWDLYDLAEKLVDLEFRFQQWRFAHMKTVERIIGRKPGTGGTSGVAYLVKALDKSFFPELIAVRSGI